MLRTSISIRVSAKLKRAVSVFHIVRQFLEFCVQLVYADIILSNLLFGQDALRLFRHEMWLICRRCPFCCIHIVLMIFTFLIQDFEISHAKVQLFAHKCVENKP